MIQAPLIPEITLTRAAARKAALQAARVRADQGMDRAARRANAIHAAWCAEALEALRKFAAGQRGTWTIEQARTVIEADPNFIPATDGRAWGVPVVNAIKAGYIVKTNKTAPACSSNGAPKPLYMARRAA